MADIDYYNILGCQENDSLEKIKKCYHAKARLFHPDKVDEVNEPISFELINKAWKTLSDPDSRRIYDAKLNERRFSNQNLVYGTFNISDLIFDSSSNTYSKICRCGGLFLIDSEQTVESDPCDISVECDSCSLVIYINKPS